MRTGDAGYFDARGHLVVIDRVRDMARTALGDRFSPQYIENKLKFSPYIAEVVVLGDGRDSWPPSSASAFPSCPNGRRRTASPSPPIPTCPPGRR